MKEILASLSTAHSSRYTMRSCMISFRTGMETDPSISGKTSRWESS